MAVLSFNMVILPPVSSPMSPRSGLSTFSRITAVLGGSWRENAPVAAEERFKVRAMAGPKYKGTQMREKRLEEMIEEKVNEAKEVCKGDAVSDKCKVAWDEVEEVSQAKADLCLKLDVDKHDPLKSFCT